MPIQQLIKGPSPSTGKKVPFGTKFDAASVTAGIASWGNEDGLPSKRLNQKPKYVPAPKPANSAWSVPTATFAPFVQQVRPYAELIDVPFTPEQIARRAETEERIRVARANQGLPPAPTAEERREAVRRRIAEVRARGFVKGPMYFAYEKSLAREKQRQQDGVELAPHVAVAVVKAPEIVPIISPKATSRKEITSLPNRKRKAPPSPSDFKPLVKAVLQQPHVPSSPSIWDEDSLRALNLSVDDSFVERPKSEQLAPPRQIAAPITAKSDLVKREFTVTASNGANLVVKEADPRLCIRNNNTTLAVASARDLKSRLNGNRAPLTYLYCEAAYPRPTADDYVNSHICRQTVSGKTVYTVMTREISTIGASLTTTRVAIQQLGAVMSLAGDKCVNMLLSTYCNTKVSASDFISLVKECLIDLGISVILVTSSPGQFFAVRTKLSLQKSTDEVLTDKSTPKNWVPTKGWDHYHKCFACSTLFVHWHSYYNADHPQFDNQCPNKECSQFHKGKNPTNSQPVGIDEDKCPNMNNDGLLQDPTWVKEASVFPAAIETAIEGLGRFFDYATDLMPKIIPSVTKEDVIRLKKTGYAGAVETPTKPVSLMYVSKAVGLNEIRPRKERPVKTDTEPDSKPKSRHTKVRGFPVTPKKTWVPEGQGFAFCDISGRNSNYEGTWYRSGLTRRQAKISARSASQWVYAGCPEGTYNRYIPLLSLPDTDVTPERVLLTTPEESEPIKIRKKAPKVSLSDEFWMDYFREYNQDIVVELPRNIHRLARKSGIRAAHTMSQRSNTVLDLAGPVSTLANVSNKIYVVSETSQVVPVYISEDILSVSTEPLNGIHQHARLRGFRYKGNLTSGSPILNSYMQLCSVITASDGDGLYALQSKDSLVEEAICTGSKCAQCAIHDKLVWHNNPNKGNKKPANNKTRGGKKNNQQPNKQPSVATIKASVELTMKAKRQAQEIDELSRRLNRIKTDARSIANSAASMPVLVGPAKKAVKSRKRQPKKQGYSQGLLRDTLSTVTGGLISKASTSAGTVMVTSLILLSCLLPTALGCFSGFESYRHTAGRVSCGSYKPNNTHVHYLSPHFGGSYGDVNIVKDPSEFWMWDWFNRVINDTLPVNIIIDKQQSTLQLDGYTLGAQQDNTTGWALVFGIIALIVLLYKKVFSGKRSAETSKRRGIVYSDLATPIVLLALMCVAVPDTDAAVLPQYVKPKLAALSEQQKAEAIITNATEWVNTFGNYFRDHMLSLKQLKEAKTQLDAVIVSLEGVGEKGDPLTARIGTLKTSLADRTNKVSSMVEELKVLKDEVTKLRQRLEELQTSVDKAAGHFEEYRSLIKRSQSLDDQDLDDIPEVDLEDDITLFSQNKDHLIKQISDVERVKRDAFGGALKLDDKKSNHKTVSTAAPAEHQQVYKRSTSSPTATTNTATTTSPSNSASNNGSSNDTDVHGASTTEIGWLSSIKDGKSTPDSHFKVKFGVDALEACDADACTWQMYDDHDKCLNKCQKGAAIGLGWGTCSIGLSSTQGDKYIIRKQSGERYLCSAACFDVNYIIKALRYNDHNHMCYGPLISGGLWTIVGSKDDWLDLVGTSRGIVILSSKLLVIKENQDLYEMPYNSKALITECCNGILAVSINDAKAFYDGPCLCKASFRNVERKIVQSLKDFYTSHTYRIPAIFSGKTLATVGIIVATAFMSPYLAIVVGVSMFAYNANADCTIKNYHTLYVGDSDSKQIYTTLYMRQGDCFTLGENTFELTNIDNVYKYKHAASYPAQFAPLCTDIDWGCGLADGSKICDNYKNDCEIKCSNTKGAIYKKHCIHTTTFHGDGCYGFLVQDHSVSVHGGVCLLTNATKPYDGYSRVEGLYSRKFTFKVTAFDQTRYVTVDSANLIYEDSDFTIQDIVMDKTRIPTYVLDAGNILCAYTDVTGNDFCHSVVGDTSKLTNQGCVNLDWTFLGDDAAWKIEDTSAVITPYVYDLFESCGTEVVSKDGDTINVAPKDVTVAFKIDSQFATSAIKVTKCASVTFGGHDAVPGFVDRVQTTIVSVTMKGSADCYVSLKLSACSLIGVNFCKISTTDTTCSWITYCPVVTDIEATVYGEKDLNSFNFTSGKFSSPTLEYSRAIYTATTGTMGNVLSKIGGVTNNVLSYIPGVSMIKSLLQMSMKKALIVVGLLLAFIVAYDARSAMACVGVAIAAWLYFFTPIVHAHELDMPEVEEDDIQLWQVILFLLIVSVNWVRICRIIYTYICRKASGLWHYYGCNIYTVGVPLIDQVLLLCSVVVFSPYSIYILSCHALSFVVQELKTMLLAPQSVMFNTEELNHTPIASILCKYVSASSHAVSEDPGSTFVSNVSKNIPSTILLSKKTCFLGDLGTHMFNSPSDDPENEPIEIPCWSDEEYEDALTGQEIEEVAQPPKPVDAESIKKVVSFAVSTEEQLIDGVPRHVYVGDTPFRRTAPKILKTRPFKEEAFVVSPSTNGNTEPDDDRSKKGKKKNKTDSKLKKKLQPKVVVALHPMLRKYAFELSVELTRIGRHCLINSPEESDVLIKTEADWPENLKAYYIDVSYSPEHLKSLGLTKDQYDAAVAAISDRNGAEKVLLKNSKKETVFTAVCKLFVEDYDYADCGKSAPRYYVTVPIGGGFDLLEPSTIPGFAKCPKWDMTANEKEEWAIGVNYFKILVVPQRHDKIPKNWIYIASAYIPGRQHFVAELTRFKYPRSTHNSFANIIKSIGADFRSIPVKSLPSLVTALNMVARSATKRRDDIDRINRPDMAPIYRQVRSLNDTDTCCTYYSMKAEVGDYIKFSVPGVTVSVYKDNVSKYINETSRTFMAFRHKEQSKIDSMSSEYGHVAALGKALNGCQFKEKAYCVRQLLSKWQHILYVVANRDKLEDIVNPDIVSKGITSAKIQAQDSNTKHIYVCFGDSKIRKYFNHIIPQLVHKLGTEGIELTLLVGKYGDMKTVCSHVNSAMKVISNGQPVGFDTSINTIEETIRKDVVTTALQQAAEADSNTLEYEVSIKLLIDEKFRGIVIYRQGRILGPEWTVCDTDNRFAAAVQSWRNSTDIKVWGREQFWLYDGDAKKIVGLLPNEPFRPKHFGLHWKDTIQPAHDVEGVDAIHGLGLFVPIAGKKDRGKMASYETYPILAQDGSYNYCIYSTELPGNVGVPIVLSEKRLMSGANVYVCDESVDNPEAYGDRTTSSGFITKCSKATHKGVECYAHRLEPMKEWRKDLAIDHLNSKTRFSMRNLASANSIIDIFRKPVGEEYYSGDKPSVTDESLSYSIPTAVSINPPNDPVLTAEVIEIADPVQEDQQWYIEWAGFNFTSAEMEVTNEREAEARCINGGDPHVTYQGHIVCPTQDFCLNDAPPHIEEDHYISNCTYPNEKLFCSIFCAQVHKNIYRQRWLLRTVAAYYRLTNQHAVVENLHLIFGDERCQISHPCLPELDRLCNALSRPGFDRKRWYDNILEGIEDDQVFYAFQISNQKRLARLNRELDATCSEVFDFPDTFYGSFWCTPRTEERGHISISPRRVNALCIHCTPSATEECFNDFPLLVRALEGYDNAHNNDFYVKLRRACVLLLAQGWNSFDVAIGGDVSVDFGRFIACLAFNQKIFGPFNINIVTNTRLVSQYCNKLSQILPNICYAPDELKVGSDFLMKRGVKTAAILESIELWRSTRKILWQGVDVAKSGLPKSECPDITVTVEDRPEFMGDHMCAIWNISNGIRSGTCYSNGMDIVGSNHCTMGNNIVVETVTPLSNSSNVKRARYINTIVKSYEGGDVDMHNGLSVYVTPRKGEIYAVLNPAQKRGRWLMCTSTDEYEPVSKSRFHKFVPVEVDFNSNTVSLSDYRLYKGLSGSPIISAKGQCAGTYGLSTNVKYSDKSLAGDARDTTLCHAMVTDNLIENENYFVEAARELVQSVPREWRFSYLEAPTGTGKSTLFPIAILHAIARVPGLAAYNICMLEPTRAAVHNCYNRVLALLKKSDDKWNKIYTLRLSTGKRGEVDADHFKSEGNGKIQLCIATYGRFIAEYQPDSTRPHSYNMLLMDEIHTRSNDEDVGTAYLLSSDRRADQVKVCYMTATSVGKVCERRLCEGKDLTGTRFKITPEYLIETRKGDAAKEGSIITDSSYFTIDLRKARLNLKTKAQFVSWPLASHNKGRCLVFLPSRNDCEKFVGWARTNYPKLKDRFVSLHAGSPVKDLESLHPEAIIGCTDYASTAITVPNCKCVVDFMEDWSPSVTLFQNETGYTYKNTVSKDVVSKQVSVQRMGRTGRTCDGYYYTCASITPIEETRLSESMYARIYFNLLIKMGRPRLLKAFLHSTEEASKIYEHEWLEPDRIAEDWMHKGDECEHPKDREALHKFVIKATRRLELVRDWDKDQLWWYLNPVVGRDYLDFCFSTENEKTHGFGVSSFKVNAALTECWTVVDLDSEAKEIRHRLDFNLESYKEDMENFESYVQRAHDKLGAISIDTLARRAQKTSKRMYETIDKNIVNIESDAKKNISIEAAEDEPTVSTVPNANTESLLGVGLGATAAAATLGVLLSSGVFAYNNNADWQAVEVFTVERTELPDAIFTAMESYRLAIIKGLPSPKTDAILSTVDKIIEWVSSSWNSLSDFFKNLLAKFVAKHNAANMNHESGVDLSPSLEAVLRVLTHLKMVLFGIWYKYGAINVGSAIASFGLGSIYNVMCETFGIVFSNAIIALYMAASSIVVGPMNMIMNAGVMVVSYVLTGLFGTSRTQYGGNLAARAGALLFTAAGGSALAFLLQGSFMSKPVVGSPVNVTNGLLAMINPYNTGVSRVSDGIIIAKMIANLCRKGEWTASDGLAVGSTLMSMLFRADAMTCMISATAGLFLGFARVYMSNTEFWFRMTSAVSVKHAETYKDLVESQVEKFDAIFDTVLGVAGVLANPMSLVSIVANIMSDITVAYMSGQHDIEYKKIAVDTAQFYSGVSMIYGLSAAVFKLCFQLRDSVVSHFETESLDSVNILASLHKLWGVITNMNLTEMLSAAIDRCKEFLPSFSSFSFEADNLFTGFLSKIWGFIKGVFKSCYDWCKEKVSVMMNRFERRVVTTVSHAAGFNFNFGSSISSGPPFSHSEPDMLFNLRFQKAAYMWKKHFDCPLPSSDILREMTEKRFKAYYSSKKFDNPEWRASSALFGHVCDFWELDPKEVIRYLRVNVTAEMKEQVSEIYGVIAVYLATYLIKSDRCTYEDLFVGSNAHRFDMIGPKEDFTDLVDLSRHLDMDDLTRNMTIDDNHSDIDSIDLARSGESEEFNLNSERLIASISSMPYDVAWAKSGFLKPSDAQLAEEYGVTDPRFWLKYRLRDTADNCIIPLLAQSLDKRVSSFGSIPNEILKLDSAIYHTPDKSYGSGDYLIGKINRPWDVLCMDNTAMTKLFSTVCSVSDNGTHITLSFRMTDASNMHINIAHSFTENAACIGLLCQTQDDSTKLVNADLAAVEIMLWPTKDGIEMIGTCPPGTAGTWDILYDSTLQFLPFFRDFKTTKSTLEECQCKFENWCCSAAPDEPEALLEFETWKAAFAKRRFVPMSYMTSIKSAAFRNVKKLATRYSQSFAESKLLNESFCDPGKFPYTKELVKYKTYYKDFAEAAHNRVGECRGDTSGLPDGIEDQRIPMTDFAVKCWFDGLTTYGDEVVYNTTNFRVEGEVLRFDRRLHHPSSYWGLRKVAVNLNSTLLPMCKSELVRVAYLMGHSALFINTIGSIVDFELSSAAGVCGCTAVYTFNGSVLHSTQAWACAQKNCAKPLDTWIVSCTTYDQTEQEKALKRMQPKDWLHESSGWLAGITVQGIKDAYIAATGVARKVVEQAVALEKLNESSRQFKTDFESALPVTDVPVNVDSVSPATINNMLREATVTCDMPGRELGPTGVPLLTKKVLRARKHQTAKNTDKSLDVAATTHKGFSPAAKRLFKVKKDLGDAFFEWIQDMALKEKANLVLDKTDTNCVPASKIKELSEKYSFMTMEELLDMIALGTNETPDIKLYLEISKRNQICSEAPWCDGWDAVAVSSRAQDTWLTDGNMHLYRPHSIEDSVVVRDITRVEKMLNHLPRDVWADCRYKNRMELPERENDIGNVYASRAACKAQLLYEYLPGFFNNHKKFFEPCCGFGGFAQFFSHQMRSMDNREYYVSSLNRRGHAMPNWSLMQASDSNCRVIRVLDQIRDGNICDPEVNKAACDFIKHEQVKLIVFDIGERFQDPSMDDAWYLAPRDVKGGFATTRNEMAPGLSIAGAIAKMVEALPEGGDGLFKVNTYSPRVGDIIHLLTRCFRKIRALKLATTPESSREFYLYCSNKKDDWSAPITRSLLMKDCIKELTWSAIFRAENMYRSKGIHAVRPRSHKWFTPDTSGVSYKMLPNDPEGAKELDVTTLPQGHAINVKTIAHGRDIHVNLEFNPDWDRRYRRMKDYVLKANSIAKQRTGKGRDSVKFDNVVRSDFTYVKGIGSYKVRQKANYEKHGVNDLVGSYLNSVAGMNLLNATYGQTQATTEFVKPARKRRLDVQPGQPEPTCVVDYIKAVHSIMSEAGRSMLGKFRFMNKEETYAAIVKTGSTGILDPGSNLREFMEIFPEWYELAWEHVLNPHVENRPTISYQSVRTKPEPKGRKDAEDGRLLHKKGVSNDTLREGTNISPRFIQFSDALTRIGHIIVFGHILDFHSHNKMYKGSINGTPPHISGRVMRSYWDLHNPVSKRVVHVGNNPELDISITPNVEFGTCDVDLKPLSDSGRLANARPDGDVLNGFEDLPGGLTIDFSALDSTVTVSERMVMTDLWKRFFPSEREKKIVEGVCRDMTYAICLDDAGDIWVRDGQRGSGEILTSIENTWLVTANIISAMSHALGISIEALTATQGWIDVLTQPGGCDSPKVNVREEIANGAKHKRFEFGDVPLLVDGDDVVIISSRRRINQIQTYMNQTRQWLSANRKVIRSGNKGGATRYLNFEELSFCSHRYEAVFIGRDAAKFNPQYAPRNDGRYAKRTDLLSVAEDNNFKIYYLPIRPAADILAKLMLTLKVKTFKWDPTKTKDGECVDLTQSKLISYLLLYPQSRWVRYTCLTLLCVTGDTLATFIEFKKRYREFNEFNLKYSSKLLSSMNSLYGVSSLDDISLREYRSDSAEIRKQHYNSKLTGHVCNTTRGKWLQASFDWLEHHEITDVYPLMWDSSVFKYYEAHVSCTADNSKISTLRELIKSNAKYTEKAGNNESGLWWRIISFTG